MSENVSQQTTQIGQRKTKKKFVLFFRAVRQALPLSNPDDFLESVRKAPSLSPTLFSLSPFRSSFSLSLCHALFPHSLSLHLFLLSGLQDGLLFMVFLPWLGGVDPTGLWLGQELGLVLRGFRESGCGQRPELLI